MAGDGETRPPPPPPPLLVACKLAVRASIFFSSSATRLSVFFCLLRVGCVTTQARSALAHRLQGPSGLAGSGSQRTLSPRQLSQARGFFASELGSWSAASAVGCASL